jgi:bifunctional UDP-N-acetylglucosamine pyrophosphorylase/glucosamine-1-phosphate N-acetyltransferase
MIIPAAGSGSRLAMPMPKLLVPVAGRPMIDHLLDLYAEWVDRFVLVLHPSFADDVKRHCATRDLPIDYAIQESPTGMLDAILIPLEQLRASEPNAPSSVWVTWCDQVAIRSQTVARLSDCSLRHPDAPLILPTIERHEPYIHFERDAHNEICHVRQRHEGDSMPEIGESDLGLFCMSARGYFDLLPEFAREVAPGALTRERNFLLFIPWLRGRGAVASFAGTDPIESLGVNTLADLEAVEARMGQETQRKPLGKA